MLNVDEYGLDEMDSRILKAIIENFDGGPVGLNSLAVAVGEDASTLEEVYEPYLIQTGYLQRTARGRTATRRAFQRFGYALPEGTGHNPPCSAMTSDSEATSLRPVGTDSDLNTSEFDYDLPSRLIAQRPAPRRDDSRLLVLDRTKGSVEDRRFPDLLEYRPPETRWYSTTRACFPARLLGHKPTGAAAEVLLLNPLPGDSTGRKWEALVRPGGKLKPGRRVVVSDGLQVRIEDSTPDGGRIVHLEGDGDPFAADRETRSRSASTICRASA